VYNSAAHPIKRITMADWADINLRMADKIPLTGMLWKAAIYYTKYKTWYYVTVIFLHLIPALLIDGLIRLRGKKPLYVNIHCMINVHIYILLIMLYLSAAGIT
jgi:fatty acyl-CoA reductase